jgi:hypothetical protein
MATPPTYGVKYQAGWISRDDSLQGWLIIDKLDYVGPATDMVLSYDSIRIRYAFENWNSPIIGMQCEFSIENNKADFFELFPLLKAAEQEYRVRVAVISPTQYQLFEGFLNIATTTHKYLRYQNIKLSASCYFNKLANMHPASIDILQNMNYITIIQELFQDIGYYHHFKVNCSLFAEGDTLESGQTLFSKNGFNTELFWVDDVEKTSSLDILKAILTTFDAYIYWWRGCWYIERYEDFWSETKNYVDYIATVGTYSDTNSAGSVVQEVSEIVDVHDLVFTDQSQAIEVNPGYNKIQINLQDKRLTNLIKPDLTNIAIRTTGDPNPGNRMWEEWSAADISWIHPGEVKNTIKNSIQRLVSIPLTSETSKGIYTRFRTTIENEDNQINVKFKYIVNNTSILNWSGSWKDYKFLFHWSLRVLPLQNYIFNASDKWSMTVGTAQHYLQEVPMDGSSFDSVNSSCEVSFSIPLGMVEIIENSLSQGKLTGDVDLILGIGIETIAVNEYEFTSPTQAWIGDIEITSTGTTQNNVITGTVSTKYLNKKDISLMLYDCESYNYNNAILRGASLEIRTERWGTGAPTINIVEKGVCWQVTANPVITTDPRTNDGTGIAAFTSVLFGLHHGTTYYVRSYYKDAAGTVVYGNQRTFQTLALSIGTPYRGGLIGYIFVPDDNKYGGDYYIPGETHGIIIGLQDLGTNIWCRLSDTPRTCGATSTGDFEGAYNTSLMLAETNNIAKYAVSHIKAANTAVMNGHADWFLPDINDLTKLFENKHLIPGRYAQAGYWSSTESARDSRWRFAFAADFGRSSLPSDSYYQKNNTMIVIPCRYF